MMKGQMLATHTHTHTSIQLPLCSTHQRPADYVSWRNVISHFNMQNWLIIWTSLALADSYYANDCFQKIPLCFALCTPCLLWSDISSFKWCFRHLNPHWRKKMSLFFLISVPSSRSAKILIVFKPFFSHSIFHWANTQIAPSQIHIVG